MWAKEVSLRETQGGHYPDSNTKGRQHSHYIWDESPRSDTGQDLGGTKQAFSGGLLF